MFITPRRFLRTRFRLIAAAAVPLIGLLVLGVGGSTHAYPVLTNEIEEPATTEVDDAESEVDRAYEDFTAALAEATDAVAGQDADELSTDAARGVENAAARTAQTIDEAAEFERYRAALITADALTIAPEASEGEASAASSTSDEHEALTASLTRATNALHRVAGRAQLDAELDDVFGDGRASAVVIDLDAGETVLARDSDEVFTAASTYKLYAAYSILQRVEDGSLSWEDPLGGYDVRECLDATILRSENPCIETYLGQVSFSGMEEVARSTGAENTRFTLDDVRTTSEDLARYLTQLYAGELLNDESTELLLDLMMRQEHRERIPAGLGSEVDVADKPGWLGPISNDAAIVYSPKGDYVMVILSDGIGDDGVAAAAGAIYDWL